MGLSRFELLTPRLSSVCSNQLSYRPGVLFKELLLPVLSKLDRRAKPVNPSLSRRNSHSNATSIRSILIGPPLPLRALA